MLPSGHFILSSMFIPVTTRCPSFPGQFRHSNPIPILLCPQKNPSVHTLLWTVPAPSSSEGNLAFPWGHGVPCSPHEWRPVSLSILGQKVAEVSFLLLAATSKPLSLSCSPISCLEAPVIRGHLPPGLPAVFSPVLRASPRFPVSPPSSCHHSWWFNIYMNSPSNLMVSPFLSLFIPSLARITDSDPLPRAALTQFFPPGPRGVKEEQLRDWCSYQR